MYIESRLPGLISTYEGNCFFRHVLMGVLIRIGIPNTGCMTAIVLRTFANRVVQCFSDAYPRCASRVYILLCSSGRYLSAGCGYVMSARAALSAPTFGLLVLLQYLTMYATDQSSYLLSACTCV
jgi:hypothetical protein